MFSYTDILKSAYYLTKRFPLLWLLGMFVLGGSNLNYLHVRGLMPPLKLSQLASLPALLPYFQQHPAVLALASLSVLALGLFSLVLANWSKIMILLVGQSCLEKKGYDFTAEIKRSKTLLWPVIQVSVLSSLFLLAAVVVLVAPIFVEDPFMQIALWALGAAIFILVVFTVSSLNIFTTMFIVLLRLPVKKALDAATDFFAANVGALLGLVAILLVIYLAGAALGLGLLGLIKILVRLGQLYADQSGNLRFSAVLIIIKSLGALVLWVWLGMLNAFLNISLLLFFLKKITPVKGEEDKKAVSEMAASPAAL